METTSSNVLTVEALINAPIAIVWKLWNEPEHIKNWAFASDDWHAPHAENDLVAGGRFKTVMAANDGSFSFDFEGTYTHIEPLRLIEYTIDDGRKVKVTFESITADETKVTEVFEPENVNPEEMQIGGWQAILNNFAAYAELNKVTS